jgi:hypothetical protein
MPRRIPQTNVDLAAERLKELERGRVEQTCLRPGCSKLIYCRGLCQWDYKLAKQAIKDGLLTWEQLEAAGRSLAPKRSKGNLEKRIKFFMTAKKL